MREYTLQEAFEDLLKDTKTCNSIGVDKIKRFDYRNRQVSESLMRELIQKAGYHVYQHETFVKKSKREVIDNK